MNKTELQTRIKSLEGHLRIEKIEIEKATEDRDILNFELKQARSRTKELKQQIEILKNKLSKSSKKVSISDHALLRYFERVLGFDVDDYRLDLQERLSVGISNGKLPIDDNTAVINDNVVVSIIPQGNKK